MYITDNPINDAQSYFAEESESKLYYKCACHENCDSFEAHQMVLDDDNNEWIAKGHLLGHLLNIKKYMEFKDFQVLRDKLIKQL